MNIDILHLFSANSANDHNYKHLWMQGASLFIPQLNELLKYTNYEFQIINIEEFMNDDSNILGQIFEYNKSDKSTSHNYHILYSYILNRLDINKKLNIFEVGLGTNNPDLISTMSEHGRPGASLFSFRDYLSNSNIYGADIDENILFESDRIKTCYIDQLDINTFNNRSVYHQYIQFMFIIFLLNIFNKNIIIIFKNIYKLNINILVDLIYAYTII